MLFSLASSPCAPSAAPDGSSKENRNEPSHGTVPKAKRRPDARARHGLIEEYGLIYNWVPRRSMATAIYEFEEIWIPQIKSSISYAFALHEIGHIRGRHQTSRSRMVCERDAWAWAKAHALIWTDAMERLRFACLGW
jgi:hypothetical protein